MTETLLAEQTLNWAREPDAGVLRRIHLRQGWRERRSMLIVVLLIPLIAGFSPAWRETLGLGIVILVLLVVWNLRTSLLRLNQAAQAAGVIHFRLEPETLNIQHQLGNFQIPLSQITRTFNDPEGLVVHHAGNSALTLPLGPVKDALLHRLSLSKS